MPLFWTFQVVKDILQCHPLPRRGGISWWFSPLPHPTHLLSSLLCWRQGDRILKGSRNVFTYQLPPWSLPSPRATIQIWTSWETPDDSLEGSSAASSLSCQLSWEISSSGPFPISPSSHPYIIHSTGFCCWGLFLVIRYSGVPIIQDFHGIHLT